EGIHRRVDRQLGQGRTAREDRPGSLARGRHGPEPRGRDAVHRDDRRRTPVNCGSASQYKGVVSPEAAPFSRARKRIPSPSAESARKGTRTMAARAYWQGQIRLALVSIPVEVYAATKSGASISFRQIHEPSGKPIKYEKVVQGLGPVDRDDIVKGYEISKGNYVLLEEDEIEAVRIESRKTLELVQFVDAHEIDVFYFEKPYFVVPQDELAEEAFVVLREALRQKGKVAIGQLSVRGRETLVSLKPCGKGIVLETLRYED